MNNSKIKPPYWYWIVAAIALIWNILGLSNFILTAFFKSQLMVGLTLEQQNLVNKVPLWAMICFGIATVTGTLGCVLLLLRKKLAMPLFSISLITMIAQFINWLVIQKAGDYFPNSYTMPTLVVLVGLFLIWFTKFSFRKNWVV